VCRKRRHGRGLLPFEYRTALELNDRYPGDSGVLVSLLLNRIILAQGEAKYLPAGICMSTCRTPPPATSGSAAQAWCSESPTD
jgi:hypothetical protein